MTRQASAPALQEALSQFAAGYFELAERTCRKVARARPGLAEPQLLLVEIYRQLGDEARAGEAFARALRLRPAWDEAQVHAALGDLLSDVGRYAEAENRYRSALAIQPALLDARYNLASALYAGQRVAEAIIELQSVLGGDPGAADARQQLVTLLQAERRFGEMQAVCREGMALHPAVAFYPNKLGVALWWGGQHDEALAAFRLAAGRAGNPESEEFADARFLEANSLLALGRLEAGWDAYRWRPTRRALRASHPELVDDPRAVLASAAPRRLRILSEQGIGDEIFFLRFAAALHERGHRLFVSCNPKIAPLLSLMPALLDGIHADREPVDFTLASGDLPLASGQHSAPPLPIAPEADRRDAMATRLRAFGPPPYVAVTWRAGLLPDERKADGLSYWTKNIPAELLGRALRSLDARVIVVQRRPAAEEARQFTDALGREALDLSAVNDDLSDMVALLSLVDDYVGVSNTNMHLRAGLQGGRPARALVFTPPEWRWGLQGSATPWFPGFIVYRAAVGRDWSDALSRLEADLKT